MRVEAENLYAKLDAGFARWGAEEPSGPQPPRRPCGGKGPNALRSLTPRQLDPRLRGDDERLAAFASYSPLKSGLRFWRKAMPPSIASLLAPARRWPSASASSTSVMVPSIAVAMFFFIVA